MSSNNPSIYIIVLAWNQIHETIMCLDSLLQTKYTNKHILLIDNGSGDGTAEVVSSKYSSVQVIRTLKNVGIARGYNLGIESES